jgi:hypothetical protein
MLVEVVRGFEAGDRDRVPSTRSWRARELTSIATVSTPRSMAPAALQLERFGRRTRAAPRCVEYVPVVDGRPAHPPRPATCPAGRWSCLPVRRSRQTPASSATASRRTACDRTERRPGAGDPRLGDVGASRRSTSSATACADGFGSAGRAGDRPGCSRTTRVAAAVVHDGRHPTCESPVGSSRSTASRRSCRCGILSVTEQAEEYRPEVLRPDPSCPRRREPDFFEASTGPRSTPPPRPVETLVPQGRTA